MSFKHPKNVALVLSSGGARGMAHIGVVEALISRGFNITSIAGSSVGALVGALYATGHLEAYRDWIVELDQFDIFKLFDFTFSTQGFIKGEKVFNEMKTFIPDSKIEDMPIPFSAIATDIRNQKEIVIESGSMYEALRASTAIPTVLQPVYRDEMELIDGGVLNPLPVNRVRRNKGDLLVVVNASAAEGHSPKWSTVNEKNIYLSRINAFFDKWSKYLPGSSNVQKKLGYFDLMNRSIDLMQDKIIEQAVEKYQPDIQVNISKKACSTFEFYRAADLIATGHLAFASEYEKFLESFGSGK